VSFKGLTNGIPNWTVDSWFINMSPQRAHLMQMWFQAGSNAAQFSITNVASHAMRVFPIAQFETTDQRRDTPVLNAPNFRGIYIGPGEVKTIRVALLPHDGRWRVGFACVRDDGAGHFLSDARRKTVALLSGTTSPSMVPDEFRDSTTISTEWIER